jgi:molecular chaperone HtpG
MTQEAATMDNERHVFQADVARLLHLMVHSIYTERDIFLRELISNAADACEKLRYEANSNPALLDDGEAFVIRVALDPEAGTLTIEDNGVGMSRHDLTSALGTIANSGTRAFLEKVKASESGAAELIGQFGIGFYSAFMVADRVAVVTRRAGESLAWSWSSDGKGEFEIAPLDVEKAPRHGSRVILHLNDDSKSYLEPHNIRAPSPRRSKSSSSRTANRGESAKGPRFGPSRKPRSPSSNTRNSIRSLRVNSTSRR